jgi:AraC-like DNA-binding protein
LQSRPNRRSSGTGPHSKRPSVKPGQVRIAPIMALPSVLAEFGVDASRLLREFKLGPAAFGDPENRVAYSTVGRIFGRCVEATSCEHFGLLVGERAGISSHGAVGYLAQSAPDVRTALHMLQRLYHMADGGGMITLDHHGGSVSFGYAIVEPDVPNAEQLIAAAVAIGFNILRALCGPQWHPSDVHFALAAPPAEAPIRTAFYVAPRFDQERSGITFPARWLARSPPGADPILHRMMRERVAELLAGAGDNDDIVSRVRRQLRTMVTAPRCSIEIASEKMGLHVRTLKRRLAAASTTFLELREEARYDTACQLLRHTRMPVNEVASSLGYAETSSFTRAFGRWAGMAPTEWRSRRAQSAGPRASKRRAR